MTLGRAAKDWVPPVVARRLRRVRARRGAPSTGPAPVVSGPVDPRWGRLTARSLEEMERCDAVYRPTSFWQPGTRRLLEQMDELGLEVFKTWPAAFFWFYPVYGKRVPRAVVKQMIALAEQSGRTGARGWARQVLASVPEARRDYDVARTAWDHGRWPMDLESYGESAVGRPTQVFRLVDRPDAPALTKPYLNYLLCLSALSRHVEAPPRRFLELGGGFGVLGEILLSRFEDAVYVNCDIPPLLTVSSYYLTSLFGEDRVLTYDDRVASTGPIHPAGSACLPSWRIEDLVGPFDVFVNSFSFQEMEPAVVAHYVDMVTRLSVEYVVSLNSLRGKPVTDGTTIGVKEQVVSSTIVAMFEARGYELCARYNDPHVVGQGELVVLKRR